MSSLLCSNARKLSNNRIKLVRAGAFANLKHLEQLYVMCCTALLCSERFSDNGRCALYSNRTCSLCRRELNNNQISSIAPDAFAGLANLKILYGMT